MLDLQNDIRQIKTKETTFPFNKNEGSVAFIKVPYSSVGKPINSYQISTQIPVTM